MKVFKVGGCVRDKLMGITPNDIDFVVVGSKPEEMLDAGFNLVGKNFWAKICFSPNRTQIL